MIFTLVLILIGALLLLVIGINVIQQQKAKAEAEKRTELARQRAIIDETDDVLSHISLIPNSSHMLLILYNRIQEALQIAMHLTPKMHTEYERRSLDLNQKIQVLKETMTPFPPIEAFQLPEQDKHVLVLVQMLKKMKAILRSEHNKGKVDPQLFIQEESYIDSLQLRINVDSMLSRGRAASYIKQYGSAKQMITKALSTLHTIKAQTPNDPFITQKVDEAKSILNEIMGEQKSTQTVKSRRDNDDIDVLFQPKKKW
ncbi:hypothetical protein [Shewanella surugensis]|uniref:DNA repair protein n=1 Tax=Shewanella surugensis TaxID=212020 RepID=A0ABT0L885_9GAMM|nr:hypothetical protein [Shewanella surugensis]MCL1123908.1 hypothetical protein [Shewanella surugensis]